MGSRRSKSSPQWQVALDEVRTQQRAIVVAIQDFRSYVEQRIELLDRESRQRDEALLLAIDETLDEAREQSSDLTELKRLYLRQGRDLSELKAFLERGRSGPGGPTPPPAGEPG